MLAWIGYIGVGRCIDEWRFLLCCGGLGFWEEVRSWLLRRPEWDGDDEYRPSVMVGARINRLGVCTRCVFERVLIAANVFSTGGGVEGWRGPKRT